MVAIPIIPGKKYLAKFNGIAMTISAPNGCAAIERLLFLLGVE